MNNNRNFLVGTLTVGENELDDCLKMIKSQNYKNFDHYIYSDLPNKEAHKRLFGDFLGNRNKYDVCIKIDGDTVFKI